MTAAPRPALPAAVDRHAQAVEAGLTRFLDEALPRVTALHATLEPLAEELASFVQRGGKRLRPVLLLLGHELAGGDPDDVIGAGVAVELLHTCALMHDDVIDDAPTRRGFPTTHVTFALRHASDGGAGSATRYGESMAILLGDLAFVHADAALLTCSVPSDRLLAGMRAFVQLREEVMAGQVLDVHAAASRSTDVELALQVATLKSGRYSVTRPLQMGAVLAGAAPDLLEGLGRVGDPLGRAFQLRDDLLGVFGDQGATGKSASGDLAEGKRTLLVAEAWARTDDAGRELLGARLGDPDLTVEDADAMRGVLATSGAQAAVEDRVEREVAEARAALSDLPTGPARDTLADLLAWFADRQA
jgi:geranylgeranyl diphosphate synthase, type I